MKAHVCWCEADGKPRGSTHQPCAYMMHGSVRICVNCGEQFEYMDDSASTAGMMQTTECKKVPMKVAYVAGPYRARNGMTVIENVRRAEEVAVKYWRLGYAVICPHLNTAFFDGLCDDQVWLAGDLEIVKRVDVVVAMYGWESSAGATVEVQLAKAMGKVLIYDDGRVNGPG